MITDKIIEIAKGFVGLQEIPGNMGFKDERFNELMESVGFQKGQAWCSYFAELVWKLAYQEQLDMIAILDGLFSAGAVKTYNNFLKSYLFIADKHCSPGSVVIWQHWTNNKPTWMGHAGIVVSEVHEHEFRTIEGNGNSKGGREGLEVAEKRRLLNFDAKKGLVLRGFIHPM